MLPEGEGVFPVVMLVHGFGGSINSAYIKRSLHKIIEAGAAAFSFNFTNLNPSRVDTSDLTPDNALQDMRAAFEFIKKHPSVDASRILGVGASFGAYTLMRYEAENHDEALKGLVLLSVVPIPLKPFDRFLTPAKKRFWRWVGHVVHEVDGLKCRISYKLYDECSRIDILGEVAPKIHKPVVIVNGDRDILASVDDIRALEKSLNASPHVAVNILEGAEHEFSYIPRNGEMLSEFEKAVQHVQGAIAYHFASEPVAPKEPSAAERLMAKLHKLMGALNSMAKDA